MKRVHFFLVVCGLLFGGFGNVNAAGKPLALNKGDSIVIIGSGMASRMNHFGHFETELQLRFPKHELTIRNLGDEGNTPAFRPHPGRNHAQQYAFPGAKAYVKPEHQVNSNPVGHFETPDQWISRLGADVVLAFFGFNSSFDGPAHVERYKKELDAFLRHTKSIRYNGKGAPRVALVSPTAVQDLSKVQNTPNGKAVNANLKLYVAVSAEVAAKNEVLFVDAFVPSAGWYADGKRYTVDGALLNDAGYRRLAPVLADAIFGKSNAKPSKAFRAKVHPAVQEKNWMWHNDFKVPNGVHVYGRRYNPFGPQNYPFELKKTREMTMVRDQAIWATLAGKAFDVAAADAKTSKLPKVNTNYTPSNRKNGTLEYLKGTDALNQFTVADGYKIELFASEEKFKDLANPVQMAFDNKGRLWVATMASYPHYRIGDSKPEDKLLILEDTNNDGKADKQTVFAGDLHIPMGFEIAHDGVYVSQSGSLVFLRDTDGDDNYDTKEVLLSGFDDHDTHHAIAAFCVDASGAIHMAEGVFLHSNVETVYGPVRGTNGGFFRYSPRTKKLTRHAQFSIPNPWGIAFDRYGQDFFLHTSGPSFSWMTPGTVKAVYGANLRAPSLLTSNSVRPTSGLEFVSSRHFPAEVQGDVLYNNSIGFLGAKQHQIIEDGTGFTTKFRQDLFVSKDLNFRPVDLEFAPDGSLYVVDWQNVLIGHMQHNARDPNRDHVHGRVYRITYPGRPLVKPANIAGAPIPVLLENLKLHEYRSRYRTRRELRGRDADEVTAALGKWIPSIENEQHLLEALWASWGIDRLNKPLLKQLLDSKDHRVRSAAIRVLRYNADQFKNYPALLQTAANDNHGRVRMEAVTAASRLPKAVGQTIVAAAQAKGVDKYSDQTFKAATAALDNKVFSGARERPVGVPRHLKGKDAALFRKGAEIYSREAHCATCHQPNGGGLPAAGFPPIAGTEWMLKDDERLIKLTLKGLIGPITVKGVKYPGQVPMTPFEHLLKDDEIAAVLTFARNSFGNKASPISADQVAKVRGAMKDKKDLYNVEALLKEHPLGK